MRLPNGYGSVFKLSGKRRNPYIVRKTVGYDVNTHPVYSVIGYYPTRKEAMMALSEYNHDPYDIDLAKATFQDIYDAWSKETFPKLKSAMKFSYNAAYKHCSRLYNKTYKDIRKSHMQACIDGSGRGYSTRSNIKMLLTQLDKYAFDNDIITKCYSANLAIGEKEESEKHTTFTDKEVLELWKLKGKPYVDETLFMLYTGCRVSEMLRIECVNVHLEENYLTGGLKTKAGRNRIIPIHTDILPIIQEHLSDNKFLFHFKNSQNTDSYSSQYCERWTAEMKKYGFSHLTHDCRHTVRSKLDSAGANKVAIDRIMGHSSQSIGEKIYTHKTVDELLETINKLVYVCPNFSA